MMALDGNNIAVEHEQEEIKKSLKCKQKKANYSGSFK